MYIVVPHDFASQNALEIAYFHAQQLNQKILYVYQSCSYVMALLTVLMAQMKTIVSLVSSNFGVFSLPLNHSVIQSALHLVRYDWSVVKTKWGMREEWRFATKDSGVQSVTIHGIIMTLKLYADNLTLEHQVQLYNVVLNHSLVHFHYKAWVSFYRGCCLYWITLWSRYWSSLLG